MDKRVLLAMLGGIAYATLERSVSDRFGQEENEYFPDFTLYDQHDQPVKFYSDALKDKIVVLNMMYTVCSGICPANTRHLLDLQQALGPRSGRDVFIYSLTLRPDIDTPAALAAYASKYRTGPGWSFLTGKARDMDTIRRKLGFFDTDPLADADISNHTGAVRIGNVGRNRWLMMPNALPTSLLVKAIDNIS